MQVLDLVRKYGWEALAILPSIQSGRALPNGNVWFVDSGAANTLNANDGVHGHTWEVPLATIDYAVGLCTASNGDIILVAPGHTESLAAATIDFDVAGITCIGLGNGSNRPTITITNVAGSVDIGANNVTIKGLRFNPSVTDILIGLDVEAAVTGALIEDCEWTEGDDAVDEFILSANVKAGCTDTVFKNCLFRTKVASAGCTAAIEFTGASDNCIVGGCRIIGNYSTAGIVQQTSNCTDLLIENCTMKVKDGEPGVEVAATTTGIIRQLYIESTGITADVAVVAADMAWFDVLVVTSDGTAAVVVGASEAEAALDTKLVEYKLDHVAHVADGTGVYPATVVDDTIIAKILSKAATAAASSYDNTTDSLEAISDALAAGTGATTALSAAIGSPTAGSAFDILKKLYYGADGTGAYPATIANDSTLAKIMAKGTPAAITTFNNTTDSLEAIRDAINAYTDNVSVAVPQPPTANSLHDILHKSGVYSYDNTTDSLEAIADALAAGTGVTTAIDADGLDHLVSTADGVDVYPASLAVDSILAMIMCKGAAATPSTYNNTTDSLEALADALAAGTGVTTAIDADGLDHMVSTADGAGVYPASVANDSILAMVLSKADPAAASSYSNTTDSLEMLSDKLGGFSGDGGAAQDDSAKASLDLAHTDLDAILADTAAIDPGAERVATFTKTNLSAAIGDTTIFTVAGGPVRVIELFGLVVNALEGVANFLYKGVPTAPGGDVNISTATAVDNKAVGTIIGTNATFGGATIVNTAGCVATGSSFIMPAGVIEMNLSANMAASDSITFYCRYQPMVAGAAVT